MYHKINKFLSILLLISSLILFFSCSDERKCIPSPDTSQIKILLETDRLDEKLFKIHTRTDLKILLNENPAFSDFFLSRSYYPDDSIFIDHFFELLHNPSIDTLWQETRKRFGDLEDIKDQFEDAFKKIKYYYPEFTPPKIQFAFTGLTQDMYVSDSLIIIGLDYYLGEDASYRPMNIPDYILKRYRKENIVPNSMLLLSQKFNAADNRDNTLLSDMIFYGKAFYFSKQMLPCVPDSIFLGYTPQEMKDIYFSQEIIWANFIENEVLFDTSHIIRDKFISERPKTLEIGQNCPGRIGRWMGWEIIRSYMLKNTEISLPDLMGNKNAGKIFETSGFKPRSQHI